MKEENNSIIIFFEIINKIPLPEWVKKNIMISLGKGIGNLMISGLDWPTSWLEAKTREIRAKSAGNERIQIEASKKVSELFQTESELANRALNYYAENIISQQSNREDVAMKFIENLPKQRDLVSDKESEIDMDWLNMFWNISQSKTNNEIKLILSNILVKEVTNPNSISPVTLNLLSVLTSEVGKSFNKLCNISIDDNYRTYIVHPNISLLAYCGELKEYGISFDDQTELEGIGLIRSINTTHVSITTDEGEFDVCDYAGVQVKFNFSHGVNIIDFTRAGRELRNLMTLTPNEKYTQYLLSLGDDKFKFIK